MTDARKITLVGGGLAGSLMAMYLGRRGHQVRLYERRGDIREAELVRGRSINLAISVRGLTALDKVGMRERVLEMCVPMRGRLMHSPAGEKTFQAYGTEDEQVIHSVPRGELNKLLLNEASKLDSVEMHFQHHCLEVDSETGTCVFEDTETRVRTTVEADLVIGADGAFSAVRQSVMKRDLFDFSQSYLSAGYKELNIPPATDEGGFRIEDDVLHIWPRGSHMMIALPNDDGSFTVTLFWPMTGEHSFGELETADEVRTYFERWYGDAVAHMPDYVEDYMNTAPSSLVTMRCYPWAVDGKVALMGDAAHAVVPFYGQGMNCAFEDCRILDECLGRHPDDWPVAIDEYQRERKANADALADLALQNFTEMSDSVASPWFLFKKKLGKVAHRLFPNAFIPVYTMVSFSNLPYAEARARGKRQERTVRRFVYVAAGVLAVAILWGVLR